MAGKRVTKVQPAGAEVAADGCKLAEGTGQEACPTFVLRADTAGHLAALIGLRDSGDFSRDVERRIREFELWMDAQGA